MKLHTKIVSEKKMSVIEVVKAVTYHSATEELLIVKRSEDDTNPLKWEFPGGGLDEELAQEAVKRELYEETGLKPDKLEKKGINTLNAENVSFKFHTFLVEVSSKNVELSNEHTDFEWVNLDEIKNFDTIDGLKKDLEVANL